MSERIRDEHREAINRLPARLKDLALEVEHEALTTYHSFHDAMCNLLERSPDEYTFEERKTALEAMGSYWD